MRARSSRRWLWFTILLLGCVLAGVQSRSRSVGPADFPTEAAAAVGQPARSLLTGAAAGVKRIAGSLANLLRLEQENERLRRQLQRAEVCREQTIEWRKEAERLRELVELRDRVGPGSVAARAIGRGPSPWFRTIELDVGRRDGVVDGCAVVAPAGLVGQVYEVTGTASKVLCLTDRRGRVGARMQADRARDVLGVCRGDGGDVLTFDYPDATVDVRPGDAVVTSGHGHGSLFPSGLAIGSRACWTGGPTR